MENAPIINFRGRNAPPDLQEKFQNWMFEAYIPILFKIPGLEAVEYYQILKENPLYPSILGVYHYGIMPDSFSRGDNPDWNSVMEDQAKTFKRVEIFWSRHYILSKTLNKAKSAAAESANAKVAPVLHLEAFRFSGDEQEKYNAWFNKWGYRVYIPLLMMLPGLEEYDHYQQLARDATRLHQIVGQPVITEYPHNLSFFHFESIEAFQNYENSPALVAYKRAISFEVTPDPVYEWYVQYELIRSWRK